MGLSVLCALHRVLTFVFSRHLQKRQSGCSASSCPSGETCCQLAGGQVGCCPAANACCCPDQQHCCGTGQCVCTGGSCTGCAQSGQCSNQKRSVFEVTRE